jgi:hypothetical protein
VTTIHGKQYVEMSFKAQDTMSLNSHGLMVSCARQDVIEKLDSFSLLLPCKLKKQFNGV